MKNTQRGLIVPLLIAIIAVLAIGGGIYYYSHNQKSGYWQKKDSSLESKYRVLGNNDWMNKRIDTRTQDWGWNVSSKNIVVRYKDLTSNQLYCGEVAAKMMSYESSGSNDPRIVGGWGRLFVADCGNYYFIYSFGDSGPILYGPFDLSDSTS